MNELQHSQAQETHEMAIAYFKVAEQYGYKFIMKVREIREKEYYKALGFDSFESYCQDVWNTHRRSMDERIQIAESFGNECNFESTYSQLGHSKSLILARMESERRKEVIDNPQQLLSGEVKNVSEMTVRELREVKKSLQEAERRAIESESHVKKMEEKHQQEINQYSEQQSRLIQQIEELKKSKVSDSPETLAKIKELEKRYEDEKFKSENFRSVSQKLKEENESLKLHDARDYDEQLAEKQHRKLQQEADLSTIKMRVAYKRFIEEAAVSSYLHGAIGTASKGEKAHLAEMVELAEKIIQETKIALSGRKIGGVYER